jgi:hypothetical protein
MATKGLVVLASLGALVLSATAPASAASAGAQTGWEYAPSDDPLAGPCAPLPPAGFYYPSNRFVLTDAVSSAVTTIELGPNVAAPQGAAPACSATPVLVPAPINITSVSITGTAACSSTNNGTFTRVNSSVAFTFDCGGATYVIQGTMNVCAIPIGPFTTQPNPECAADPTASAHLVTTYTSAP